VERSFPIQGFGLIPWAMAERAYETYTRLFGASQSLDRLAERGGFGFIEWAMLWCGQRPMDTQLQERCVAKAVQHLIHEVEKQP